MEVVRIPLADTMRFGGRDMDAATVRLLSESMGMVGQLTPILVRKGKRQEGPTSKETFWIIAGRHRVQAARDLGWSEIDAVISDADTPHAELCEIDENLVRAELSDAERAKAHVRREELMVQLGLAKAGRGGDRKSDQNDNLSFCSYAERAAADLGVDKRTVQRDLARGKKIAPEVLAEVAGTDLDKGVVLDELARTPRELQAFRVAEIRERQEADKLNRYADKAVARSSADEAAEIIHANLDLEQVDALMARLAPVTMKEFLAALSARAAGSDRAA